MTVCRFSGARLVPWLSSQHLSISAWSASIGDCNAYDTTLNTATAATLSIAKNKYLFILDIVTVDHAVIPKVQNDKHANTVWFGCRFESANRPLMVENQLRMAKCGYQSNNMQIIGYDVIETPVDSTRVNLKKEDLERLIDGLSNEFPSRSRESLCHLATYMANQLDHSRDTQIYVDRLIEGSIAGH